MNRRQKGYWLAQTGGWGFLGILIFLATVTRESEHPTPLPYLFLSIGIFFFSGITLSHGMRYLFIRWQWLDLRLGPLIPRVLLMSFGVAAVMVFIDTISTYLISPQANPFRLSYFLLETSTSSIFFMLWNGMYFSFHFFQKSREQELNNLQLTATQREIELKNLRSQLNPHFLFNSLNSIRALVDIDPNQAKTGITTLANLLRKSLVLGKEQFVPLKDELDLVSDYLELEKVRFEERLRIEIHHDESLDRLLIPPFILQTLVENAFKHGISKLIDGGTILIETYTRDGKIILRVVNDGELGERSKSNTAIGIDNTKRRLELQFGSNAKFTLKSRDGKVQARIELVNQQL